MNRIAILRAIAACLVLGLTVVAITACNTVKGAGEDIEDVGQGISDAAESVAD